MCVKDAFPAYIGLSGGLSYVKRCIADGAGIWTFAFIGVGDALI